jgi:hypothetical protein
MGDGQTGSLPAGSTSRLIVLVCREPLVHEITNDQQPGAGTSTSLGNWLP